MRNAVECIRVAVADDYPIIREGIRQLFSGEDDITLVAMVGDGLELLQAVRDYKPHVVVSDLKMPGMDGPEACARLRALAPETGVIAFSMYDSEDLIRQMKMNGARGYVLKEATAELGTAVRAVHAGGEYYCSSLRKRIDHLFQHGRLGRSEARSKEEFGETELRIIRLICSGKSTKEIAHLLGMKERTVLYHKEEIEEKMDVQGVVRIAVYAMQHWLLV